MIHIPPMPALTLYQPWASLVAIGAKQYETRSWATKYRGPISIHAAAKDPLKCALGCGIYGDWGDAVLKALNPGWNPVLYSIEDELEDMPTGCIIATAELVECWPIVARTCEMAGLDLSAIGRDSRRDVTGDELLFGDFSTGRYAWELRNVQMLDEPIPAKGRQGLWRWEGVA